MRPAQVLGMLALAAAVALPMTTYGQAPVVSRITNNWATGSAVETSTQTYGTLVAVEYYDVKGLYDYTRIEVSEQVFSQPPISFGYRTLGCTVDRGALRVTAKQASVSASLDASSPACDTWGYYCGDSGCFPWGYSGVVPVGGTWHDSRYTTKGTSSYQSTDSFTGMTWKQTCLTSSGYQSQGGFEIGANTYLFGPLGFAQYQHVSCNSNVR